MERGDGNNIKSPALNNRKPSPALPKGGCREGGSLLLRRKEDALCALFFCFSLLGETADDGVAALFHHSFYVVGALRERLHWLVDDECQRSAVYPVVFAGTWHELVGADDRYWYDGQLKLVGKEIGSALEAADCAVVGARAFGEDYEAHAATQGAACAVVAAHDVGMAAVVDEYLS